VAQRETELEDQIYDASLSVVVLLEDVAAATVIEYSFTRLGTNPVFGSHTPRPRSCRTSPVTRAILPTGLPPAVRIRPSATDSLQPKITTAGSTNGIRMVGG